MRKDATSDNFLDQVSQNVNLGELKQVERSCYFDQNLNFAAIISQIRNEELKKKYGNNNYLLEVWSDGELLFQRPLKKNVRAMNSSR